MHENNRDKMNYDEHCLVVLRVFIKIYCMLQSLLINL